MAVSTVASRGQVTIPKDVRRALGIRQGSRVALAINNGKIEMRVLHRTPEAGDSGYGMLDARGKKLPADFDPASLLGAKPGARR